MGRDREGRVGGAVAAQAVLSMARAGLEPRRQPDDQRHDQGPLARGAGGGGSGGIILRRHCEETRRRSHLPLWSSEERRVGTERVRMGRCRWSSSHQTKKIKNTQKK